jgi:predicted CoA-substrate-specific enzyme activase
MITAGIDAGAATTKVALLDEKGIAGYRIRRTAFNFLAAADEMYRELLVDLDIEATEVAGVYATGYGRMRITFADHAISEITAHARGVYFLFPEAQGIIDVGGQDSKIIVVEKGRVRDFLMNDKCAAGTGKFLEYTAKALEVPIEEMGSLALASHHPADITSMCTVFAETEVISLRAAGVPKEDIAAGLIASIGQRIAVMAKRAGLQDHIAFVGGVAKNVGMKAALEKELGVTLFVPSEPQLTGAIGAAIAAREKTITRPIPDHEGIGRIIP